MLPHCIRTVLILYREYNNYMYSIAFINIHITLWRIHTYRVGFGIFHSEGLVVVAYKPSTVNLVVELFMRSISNANVQQCHASFACNFVI